MEQTLALPQKKNYTGYIVSGLILAGGAIFAFVIKGKDGLTFWQRMTAGAGAEKKEIPKVETPTDTPPAGSAAPKWIKESFPLSKGMYGGQIKNLQKALGLKDDGKFGSGTENKVMVKFGSPTVTKPQYDSLVNPVAKGGGKNFADLVKNIGSVGKSTKDGITVEVQGANTFYTFRFYINGRFIVIKEGKKINIGSYIDGGKKMSIDGAGSFSRAGASTNIMDIVNWIDGGAKPLTASVYQPAYDAGKI